MWWIFYIVLHLLSIPILKEALPNLLSMPTIFQPVFLPNINPKYAKLPFIRQNSAKMGDFAY
jgi:hypothetical protein